MRTVDTDLMGVAWFNSVAGNVKISTKHMRAAETNQLENWLTPPPQIPEADKFKKPYIKVVRDSCLWDSGRWEGWEIILGLIPHFFRDI